MGLLFLVVGGSAPDVDLPRLGPYGITDGASKLRAVAEKIDAEKERKKESQKPRAPRKQQRPASKKTDSARGGEGKRTAATATEKAEGRAKAVEAGAGTAGAGTSPSGEKTTTGAEKAESKNTATPKSEEGR